MPPGRTNLYERYKLGEVLGHGGMGVLYRAFDRLMQREVALKTILDIEQPQTLDLFYKECGILAAMVHPNIINVYDVGEFEENGIKKPFFVMPLLAGSTLDVALRSPARRFTMETLIGIVSQACRGLQAAHEMGLVHRDVKPSNIFVLEDGAVKIIDFGIARSVSVASMTALKGTLSYMAPEQLQHKPPTPLSDQYSLAVVCYEGLTGRRPFQGASESELAGAILRQTPPPVSELNPDVPYPVSQVIRKAMAKQPALRFPNMGEFGDALNQAARGQPLAYLDAGSIEPRVKRAAAAFETGDLEFASELLAELEGEGYLDEQITLLRRRLDQAMARTRIRQLLESANRYIQAVEYPLAMRKIQEALELDPQNPEALLLEDRVEQQRREKKVEEWLQLAGAQMQSQSFQQAREALDTALRAKPNDARVLGLFAELSRSEQDSAAARLEKSDLNESAVEAWERGEMASTLAYLEQLAAIEAENPDPRSARAAAYQRFYGQVRSECDSLENSYKQARLQMGAGDFEAALATCRQCLNRHPDDTRFRALRLDVEERERRLTSPPRPPRSAEELRADEEPDLDRRVKLLAEAAARHPAEPHFSAALKRVTEQRDLVQFSMGKARFYEERGQLAEALEQWRTVQSCHPAYPGLDQEIARVTGARDTEKRQAARKRRIDAIGRALWAGDYDCAERRIQAALEEFPGDPEFSAFGERMGDYRERTSRAFGMLEQAREHAVAGRLQDCLPLLRQACELDGRNPVVLRVAINILLDHARRLMSREPEAAESVLRQALQMDPDHVEAQTLLGQAAEGKRKEFVARCVEQARQMQAQGDVAGALAMVRQGLESYPGEATLEELQEALADPGMAATRLEIQLPPPPSPPPREDTATWSGLSSADVTGNFQAPAPPPPPPATGAPATAAEVPFPGSSSGVELDQRLQGYRESLEPSPTDPFGSAEPAYAPPAPPPPATVVPVPPARPSPRRMWLIVALTSAGVLVLLALGTIIVRVVTFNRQRQSSAAAVERKVALRSSVAQAAIYVDGQPCGTGSCEINLPTGQHNAEARLDGYKTAASPFEIHATDADVPPLLLTLEPRLPAVIVSTNLNQATVAVDQGAQQTVENGEIQLTDLAPGQHTIRFRGEGAQGVLTVGIAPGAAPTLDQPIQQQNVGATVVSVLGGAVKVVSTLQNADADLDGKPAGKVQPTGLDLTNLAAGAHLLTLTAQGISHRVMFDSGPAPAMTVFFGVDRNQGALRIFTGEDDVTVFVNGVKTPRATRNGRLVIYLAPKAYTIRVAKDGFQPAPEQTVEIKRGQDAKADFQLFRLPQSGSLAVRKAPAGAEVSLDGTPAGTVHPDGTFSFGELKPGQHTVAIKKESYKPLSREVNIVAGQHQDIDGTLQMLEGTVKIAMAPADVQATLSWKRDGEETSQTFTDNPLTLPEGSYTISGHAPGFEDAHTSVKVSAGRPVSAVLAFRRIVTKKPEPVKQGLSLADLEKTGGWIPQNGVLTRTGGNMVVLQAVPGAGTWSFQGLMQNRKHLVWVVNYEDARNCVVYELSEDKLERTESVDGRKQSNARHKVKVKLDQWIQVTVGVTQNAIVVSIQQDANRFPEVDRLTMGEVSLKPNRSFLQGHFGFRVAGKDQLAVGTFTFMPN
jgi:serine/threonine-protein kinase